MTPNTLSTNYLSPSQLEQPAQQQSAPVPPSSTPTHNRQQQPKEIQTPPSSNSTAMDTSNDHAAMDTSNDQSSRQQSFNLEEDSPHKESLREMWNKLQGKSGV